VDLAPEALTAPLASITQPELDYESLDFYANPGSSYQLQLECAPARPFRQLGCRAWARGGTGRGETAPSIGLGFKVAAMRPATHLGALQALRRDTLRHAAARRASPHSRAEARLSACAALTLFSRRPLASKEQIDLGDPFLGDLAAYAGEEGAQARAFGTRASPDSLPRI